MSLRFSLPSLLLLVAIVAGYLAANRLYSRWYASAYSAYYVNDVLASRIHDGDPISHVAQYFEGYAPAVSKKERELVLEIYSTYGIDEDDEFFHFQLGRSGALLQFRNAKLVNLTNEDYRDSELMARINGYKVPPSVFRYGALPFYLAFVLAGIAMWWLCGPVKTDGARHHSGRGITTGSER